eukprot:comp13900_c0_seq1/m.19653 comp13900_c0_seq1/g.19653  ORF comp13900_c0_seq1/g.19653 comp13900_c0_seq1/m.19653 type:complete len:117 (-) comp13900_c0_seq1:49-399(-)
MSPRSLSAKSLTVDTLETERIRAIKGYFEYLMNPEITARVHGYLSDFQRHDLDHSGFITVDELQPTLSEALNRKVSAATTRRILAKIDLDDTGHLDFYEFLIAVTNYKSSRLCIIS